MANYGGASSGNRVPPDFAPNPLVGVTGNIHESAVEFVTKQVSHEKENNSQVWGITVYWMESQTVPLSTPLTFALACIKWST